MANPFLAAPVEGHVYPGTCRLYTEWVWYGGNGQVVDRVHGYSTAEPTDFEQSDEGWAQDNAHSDHESGSLDEHHNEFESQSSCKRWGEEV